MPRFHFHIVEDERVVNDEEGQDFSTKKGKNFPKMRLFAEKR
jgi:hypothetical protein